MRQTHKLFKNSWLALFTMFTWELVEEGFETLIAFCVSEVFTLFIVKALSTLAIIGATQGIKVCIKRFLVPLVKTLTYKEGYDKMNKVKRFFNWLWCNKKTLGGTVMASLASIATAYSTYGGQFSFLPPLMWLGLNWTSILVGVAIFVLLELGVTGVGFERIATYLERVTKEKALKEEKAIMKEAKKEIATQEKLANQTQAEQCKAKAKAEAEKKAELEKQKADAEHRAKVELAKRKLLAENNK